MHQPPGFVDSRYPHHVSLLQRSLYSLKQAPRAWFQRFAALLQQIIGSLNNEFDMTDLGGLNYFLGISADRTHTESKLGTKGAPVQNPTLYRSLARELQLAALVYCDNVGAVYMSVNPVQHQRTKHIEIDIHFVRDMVTPGQFRVAAGLIWDEGRIDKGLGPMARRCVWKIRKRQDRHPSMKTAIKELEKALSFQMYETSHASSSESLGIYLCTGFEMSQVVHNDLELILKDDLEEMVSGCGIGILSMKARKFLSENWNRSVSSMDCDTAGCQISDNNRKGVGYNVVPPPPTGLFAPPTIDLSNSGLEEFKQPEFKGYGVKVNKSVSENSSNEIKKTSGAPIIEDWIFDCDEDETSGNVVRESVMFQIS
ncbi:ribonuclease H-like domain-containing protein [Tanacetum coccineum]